MNGSQEEQVDTRGTMYPENAAPQPGSRGVDRIAAERRRQVEAEGWTPEHDLEHDAFILPAAGACYARYAAGQFRGSKQDPEITPLGWPFDAEWWKPSPDPVRNLEKAGALIAAGIDRQLREVGP